MYRLWGSLCLIACLSCGCGYGDVSPATYEYAKALYSVSNRRSKETLDEVQRQIQESLEQGEISSREAGWLNDIVRKAEREDWGNAMTSARQMMEDQVQRR